ncbi:MAG: C13 family peptidase [Thermodesulfobacteriota bacterium]|nr:C13 family peptidase [Thermodesulfobacteriota bacterium]
MEKSSYLISQSSKKGGSHISLGNPSHSSGCSIYRQGRAFGVLSDGTGGIYIGTDIWDGGLAHLSFGQKNELYDQYQDETIISGTRAAIIIAAGSSSPRKNKFWYATEYLTSQVIYSLFYNRGYDHSELYYLSPKSWANFNADVTGDHIVDAPVTSVQFGNGVEERDLTIGDVQKAFEWAKEKGNLTQPLYLYFVDHGEKGKLMLTRFDALEGEVLAEMIDDYQAATGNQVVIILDVCHSGSLIPFLSGPDRVIITSSSTDETSKYDQNGDMSFSAAFCMNIAGTNLKDAFRHH